MTMRSLYSGVSGLRSLQTSIDVIGNNIANVNTIGFKAGRVTFSDLFSQTINGAQSPSGDRGGINPRQVGLGVQVGSIDTIFTQGSIQTTNRLLDLAIQGNGFFALSDGQRQFYTRAGNFVIDGEGFLSAPGTGLRVLGRNADETGVIDQNSPASSLQLLLGLSAPAETTDNVTFGGNLRSNIEEPDTARALSTLVSLFDASGRSLNLRNGDVIQITAGTILGVPPSNQPPTPAYNVAVSGPINVMTVTETSTLSDLVEALTAALQNVTGSRTLDVDFDQDGTLSFSTSAGESLTGVRLGVESALGRDMTAFNEAFTGLGQFTRDITIGPGSSVKTQVLRQPDAPTSILVYDSQGNARNLTVLFAKDLTRVAASDDTALISIRDREGNQVFTPELINNAVVRITGTAGAAFTREFALSSLPGQTFEDLLTRIRQSLHRAVNGIPESTVVSPPFDVDIVRNDDGSLTITNNHATQGLTNVVFSLVTDSGQPTERSYHAIGELFAARNRGRDDGFALAAGGAAVTTNTFYGSARIQNQWNYRAIVPILPQAQVDSNELGTVVFRSDGRFHGYLRQDALGNQIIQDTPPVLTFDPDGTGPQNDGVNALTINLNMNALTQNAGPRTAAIESQDGSPVGELENITIGENGIITGIFSNGESRTLAQILIAGFANEEGLEKRGDSLFAASANSGEAVLGDAGTRDRGIVRSSTLELSNVDLANEFTNLIVNQRAFQANSRIITTGDNLLNEVVNLVR